MAFNASTTSPATLQVHSSHLHYIIRIQLEQVLKFDFNTSKRRKEEKEKTVQKYKMQNAICKCNQGKLVSVIHLVCVSKIPQRPDGAVVRYRATR